MKPWKELLGVKKSLWRMISIVSLRGMLVKRLSMSRETMKSLSACGMDRMFSAKDLEFLREYSLVVRGDKIGTKNFARL